VNYFEVFSESYKKSRFLPPVMGNEQVVQAKVHDFGLEHLTFICFSFVLQWNISACTIVSPSFVV
jgi:hypothetical protein